MLGDADRTSQRAQQIVALEFVVFTLGVFFQTAHHGISTRYRKSRIQQVCEERIRLVSLNMCIRIILGCTVSCMYLIVSI